MEIVNLVILGVVAIGVVALVTRERWSLKRGGRREILVDTSVLIDGRILAVAKTGFIGDVLLIPRSVVGELQLLADGADSEKRSRARYGLDVVRDLQQVEGLIVKVLQDDVRVPEGVDNRLLELAKKRRAGILTNDFNLNKVAVVEGVLVLNVNELAQGLRAEVLPGEQIELELTQKGSENGQAVGHLADGTMVVVENAARWVGKRVTVEFIRYLQTSAGRMMFARRVGGDSGSERGRRERSEVVKEKKAEEVAREKVVEVKKIEERKVMQEGKREGDRGGRRGRLSRREVREQRREKGRSGRAGKPENRENVQSTDRNVVERRNSRRRASKEDELVRLANEG